MATKSNKFGSVPVGAKSRTSLEKALIKVLGGAEWMVETSDSIRDFSPNNIKLLAITQDAVIVRMFISTPYKGKKVRMIVEPFNPSDMPSAKADGTYPKIINRIIQRRKMNGLEDLMIWQGYVGTIFDLNSFAKDYLVDKKLARLRAVSAIGQIPNEAVVDAFKKANIPQKDRTDVPVLMCVSEYLQQQYGEVQLLYASEDRELRYAKNRYLNPRVYEMDYSDGDLATEYKKISQALIKYTNVEKCKDLLRRDIEDYPVYDELRVMRQKSPVTEAQKIVTTSLNSAQDAYSRYMDIPKLYIGEAVRELNEENPSNFAVSHGMKNMLRMFELWDCAGSKKIRGGFKVFGAKNMPKDSGIFNAKGLICYALYTCYMAFIKKGEKEKIMITDILQDLLNAYDPEQWKLADVQVNLSLRELIGYLRKIYNIKEKVTVTEDEEEERELTIWAKVQGIRLMRNPRYHDEYMENEMPNWKEYNVQENIKVLRAYGAVDELRQLAEEGLIDYEG